MQEGAYISQATERYWLDPVAVMNKGLSSYNAADDVKLRQAQRLTKLPGVPYPEPTVASVKMSQANGQHSFPQSLRDKASCTRPQLDIMPDRMSSEYHPIPASARTIIEPFPREGSNARWIAKDRQR